MRTLGALTLLASAACGAATSQRKGDEFDRGSAQAAMAHLGEDCRAAAGPSGRGHVKVTFAPDGSVTAAVLDKGPDPGIQTVDFAGTPRGDCVLKQARALGVPAFDAGAPVSVGKGFLLE